MPFYGILLKHGAYGLYMPGIGINMCETCWKLFREILGRCTPEDMTEAAENINKMMVVQDNGLDTMWYIMKVVAKIIEAHRVPAQPKYNGNLSRHGRA